MLFTRMSAIVFILLPLVRPGLFNTWNYLSGDGKTPGGYLNMEYMKNRVTGDIYNTSLYANTLGRLRGGTSRRAEPVPLVVNTPLPAPRYFSSY